MKAARLHEIGQPLRVEDIPITTLGPEDVLVRIRASGICHSDLNYRNGIAPVGRLPITLGHEIAGVIEKKGERAPQVNANDRVVVHYVVSCGKCEFCNSGRETYCDSYRMIGKDEDGGFAEYVRVPAANVLKIPESLTFDQAAIMGCAVSTAFHALRRGRAEPETLLMVYGVGGLGAHAIQLASSVFKIRNIIAVDIADSKLELAKRFGAKNVVNPAKENLTDSIRNTTGGAGAELVLDFVGHGDTIRNSIESAGKGGRVVVVGIGSETVEISPYRTLIGREIEIMGVNDHLESELAELIQLAGAGELDLSRSVTRKVNLEEVNDGMEILETSVGNPVRVVIEQ
jgi:propanol-preferring alcohol dehydrogenase